MIVFAVQQERSSLQTYLQQTTLCAKRVQPDAELDPDHGELALKHSDSVEILLPSRLTLRLPILGCCT